MSIVTGNTMRFRRLFFVTAGLIVLALTACSGLSSEPKIVATQPPSSSASSASPLAGIGQNVTTSQVGSEIFAQDCTACHGTEGRGDGDLVKGGALASVPNLTDAASLTVKTRQEYFDVITNGRMDKMMPPWKNALTDQQRWAVTDYVYELGHPGELASAGDTSSSTDEAPAVAAAATVVATAVATDTSAAAPTATASPVAVIAGTVTGKVSNGTAGGTVPEGLTATLHTVDSHFEEVTTNANVAPDGTFTFNEVEIQADKTYVVTVSYQDQVFASTSVIGDPNQTAYDLPLLIYELSDDPALAQIDTLYSQISLEGDRLLVIQLATFSVTGDHALRSVHLNIPEGAQVEDLSGGSQRYQISEDGRQVIDNMILVPGVPHTTHIGYSVPYTTGDVTIAQPVDYAVNKGFEVINDINGISISGDGIQSLGGRNTGMSFGNNAALPAGATIQFKVSGFPTVETTTTAPTDTTTPTSHMLAYILIALGLISIGLALVLAFRERSHAQTPNANTGDDSSRVNVLVRQIAALDVEHQAGKISDAAYEKRRYALKSQLLALAKHAGAAQE